MSLLIRNNTANTYFMCASISSTDLNCVFDFNVCRSLIFAANRILVICDTQEKNQMTHLSGNIFINCFKLGHDLTTRVFELALFLTDLVPLGS